MLDDIIKFPRTAEALTQYGREVRNRYQDKLIINDHLASGKLLNSIEFYTVFDDNDYQVWLTLEDYWKYVEEDTRPHMPPVDKIYEWVRIKPVLPRPYKLTWRWTTKDGKEHENSKTILPTPEQLSWIIAKGIEKNGTEGTHDLQETLEEVNARYMKIIMDALNDDLYFAIKADLGMLVKPFSDSNLLGN